MSTSSAEQPRRSATAATSASASAVPAGPLATLAFLATTTTARARPSRRCSRLIVTLGPVKRLRVKTPAAGTGVAAAMTTKSSVSSLTPTLATWQPKPAGSRCHRELAASARRPSWMAVNRRSIAAMSRRWI